MESPTIPCNADSVATNHTRDSGVAIEATLAKAGWYFRLSAVTASLVALVVFWSSLAFAQAQIQAKADVNGRTVVNVNNADVPNATGSAIAAAKIFHPAAGQSGSSYQVNGAVANAATEAPILDTIATLARPIADNAGNAIRQRPFINGTRGRIATCTVTDTVAGPGRPCRVVPRTGSFPLVNKGGAGISSDTGVVQRAVGVNNYELATATASQKTLANGRFQVIGNPGTQVNPADRLPDPIAVAYATNRDPMAAYWGSSSNRNFTLDLSQLEFSLTTQGPNTAASGYFAVDAAVIDGSTDITQPEDSATPIFALTLPLNDVNGFTPTINLAAFQLSAAGAISDNLGDVGLVNVATGLLGDLVLVNGNVQFATPYSITVGVPGNNMQSVLFVDTQTFAESVVTPEPSTLLYLGSGLLCVGGVFRRRINIRP